jgi:hypothetical protein
MGLVCILTSPKSVRSAGWETKTYVIYCIEIVLYICTTPFEGALGLFSGLGILSTLVSC